MGLGSGLPKMTMEKATLSALRRRVAAIETANGPPVAAGLSRHFALDHGPLDRRLGGGLATGVLHEVFPETIGDSVASSGFTAMLALLAAPPGREIVWIRQDYTAREIGELDGDGLSAVGFDPSRLILVRLRDPIAMFRAAVDALRCSALGAVVIEPWGDPKGLDLTVQRRFSLAAETSGVTAFLSRPGAAPTPGAAETRWLVRSSLSRALPMKAPGPPAFDLTLLRYRHGKPGGPWHLEWNRDDRLFQPPALLRDPPALSEFGPAAPPAEGSVFRLAG